MYAAIRRYKTSPGGATELARRVTQGFVPIISKAPGFVAYYVVDAGNDVVASISVFQDQAGGQNPTGWRRIGSRRSPPCCKRRRKSRLARWPSTKRLRRQREAGSALAQGHPACRQWHPGREGLPVPAGLPQ